MSHIILQNINKTFQNNHTDINTVLSSINLKIDPGEFVTIIGPSGCGKSTLLNIIAGLVKPDSGKVIVNDREIDEPSAERIMVFQENTLFPWLTVLDNITFGLLAHGTGKQDAHRQARKQLKAVHLADWDDAYPHQLSGGMKQRVEIARALAVDPDILLMDEPFGALDEQTREILQEELIELWQQTEKTIVFVTHNIREAIKLSSRILVFGTNPGRLRQVFLLPLPYPRQQSQTELLQLEEGIKEILFEEIGNRNMRRVVKDA